MDTELLIVTILKALVEIAAMFLLGQGLLYVLAGKQREGNAVYRLLRVLTRPVMRFTRFITPRTVLNRHLPLVALLLLAWLWLMLVWAKVHLCTTGKLHCTPQGQAAAQAIVVADRRVPWRNARFNL